MDYLWLALRTLRLMTTRNRNAALLQRQGEMAVRRCCQRNDDHGRCQRCDEQLHRRDMAIVDYQRHGDGLRGVKCSRDVAVGGVCARWRNGQGRQSDGCEKAFHGVFLFVNGLGYLMVQQRVWRLARVLYHALIEG